MADLADLAADAEQLMRDQALAKVRGDIAAGQVLETADNCCDCGDMIPSARQAAVPGVQRCVHCAEIRERRSGTVA